MLLFRSEEHLDRWLVDRGLERGGILSLDQCWRLAQAWYEGRMSRSWRRRTPDEAQAVLDRLGLTGPFWQLR